MSWKHIATVADGQPYEINGLNIWNYQWQSTGEAITVKNPLYEKDYALSVYKITANNKTIEFAAGEFSNTIYGIYQRSY